MTFNPLTEPVDYVLIAGQRSPGIAEITGANLPHKIDERKGYGLSGAYPVYRGRGLVKPTLTIKLYDQDDWDAWHEWKGVLAPPNARRPRALDIWHPILEEQGVTSVMVENIGQPERTSEDGEWSIAIKLVEYRRPRLALAVPEGSENGAGASEIDRRNARNASERAGLDRDMAQATAGGGV